MAHAALRSSAVAPVFFFGSGSALVDGTQRQLMDLDATALFSALVLGSIGLGLFVYGKKQARVPQLLAGILLMVIPILPGGSWTHWGLGAAVLAGVWFTTRAGW